MLNILIIGVNSYIGDSIFDWLKKWDGTYKVQFIDAINLNLSEISFKGYNAIIHVAAIVHRNNINSKIIYKVNRDLPIKVAEKAKIEGVNQFVFLSSLSIYGVNNGIINNSTIKNPKNDYAKSKFLAEEEIYKLGDNKFVISIVRPPMVYGNNCPGNYQKLSEFVKRYKFFLKTDNKRSMVYIDVLVEYIRILLNLKLSGFFVPQNIDFVNTSDMVKEIGLNNNIRIYLLYLPFIGILKKLPILRKIFGDLIYVYDSEDDINKTINVKANIISFKESMKKTEGKGL